MAYLFVTDAVWALTYEPYGGENAVIIQPGEPPDGEVTPMDRGPSLHHLVDEIGAQLSAPPEQCEFRVSTIVGSDPEPVEEERRREWVGDPWLENDQEGQCYFAKVTGTGGATDTRLYCMSP